MDEFVQQLANGVTKGSYYALIALGYTMVYGIIQLINFAHGEVFMLGAMIGLWTFNFGASAFGWSGTSLVALVVVMAMATLLTPVVSLERFAYRPLRNAPRLAPLITALGASFALQQLVAVFYSRSFLSFPDLFPNTSFNLLGARIQTLWVFMIAVALLLTFTLTAFIRTTRLGKAMRATAEDPDTARLMGINVDMIVALTFIIGSALAGVGGVLAGMYIGQVNFFMGFIAGLKAFTAAVLGGIGNIGGAVLGAFLLGILETLGAAYLRGVAGRVRLRRPHPGAGLPADRVAGRAGARLMAAPTAVASRQRAEARAEARARFLARLRLPLIAAPAGAAVGLLGSYLYWTLTSVRVEGVPLTGRLVDFGFAGVTWSLVVALVALVYSGLVLRSRSRTSTQAEALVRLGIGLAVLPLIWVLTLVLFLDVEFARIGPGPWVTAAGGVLVWLSAGRSLLDGAGGARGRAVASAVDAGRPGRDRGRRAGRVRGVPARHRDRRPGRVPGVLHRPHHPRRHLVDPGVYKGLAGRSAATRGCRWPCWPCCCCCSPSPRPGTPSGSR